MHSGRAVIAALVLASAGCASVPRSGSVHLGRPLPGVLSLDTRDVRAFPSGPLTGQTPTELVRGYLDALIDSDANYGVARSFLAPGTSWSPAGRITVYNESSEAVRRFDPSHVVVSVTETGVIDDEGHYRAARRHLDVPLTVVRHGGQWRISHLPDGVLLSSSDTDRTLEPADLYFLNAAQTRVVPVPILLEPDQPGFATTLVQRLLAGPGRELGAALTTVAPRGVGLVGNVPVDGDGVAEVDLSGGVQQLTGAELQRLSAQIVWTLRQVPGVTAVRLLGNATPLADDAVPRLQPILSWQQFDPAAPPPSRGALAVDGNRFVGIGRSVPHGLTAHGLVEPAVSADGATVAAIRLQRRGDALLVGPALGNARVRYHAAGLASPGFDPDGDVFVVASGFAGSTVSEVLVSGRVRPVELPAALRESRIDALSISRDGARIALIVGDPGRRELVVAGLQRGESSTRVAGAATVMPALADVSGVAWSDADQLVTTALRGGHRTVVLTAVDGYRPRSLTAVGLPAPPQRVAAAPGEPILAAAGGQIWSLSSPSWHRVSPGTDPSYAG
jgi:hypothetical protein